VSISPTNATLFLGATQQFTATVSNASNTAVGWSVNGFAGGNATVGTITTAGLYTAPQNLPQQAITVQATSLADTSKGAAANITVQSNVAVSVTPSPVTVLLGATQQFTASVTGSGNPNPGVNWSASGTGCSGAACGTIDAAGVYTAPQLLPSPASVEITATSQADATKAASSTVDLSSGNLSVTVTGPASVDNAKQAQFTATITPEAGSNPSHSVAWSLSGAGCTGPGCGTIDGAALYTAPTIAPSPNTVTITATSLADRAKSGSADTTINSIVAVIVDPPSASVHLENTQQFTATVAGTTNQNVTWFVNNIVGGDLTVGTVTNPASGPTATTTYTAPVNKPTPDTVTVRATSQADPAKSATAMVTLFSDIGVALSPASSVRAVNHFLRIRAQISNTSNSNIQWFVNGIPGGDSSVGQICLVGLTPCQPVLGFVPAGDVDFLTPATVPAIPNVIVRAVSQADALKSGTALIQVTAAIEIFISPTIVTVPPGGTRQFTASFLGTSNVGVTWAVNGVANGDATLGLICVVGSSPCQPPPGTATNPVEYRAPAIPPNPASVTVSAISVEDPLRQADAAVTIATGVQILSLQPSSLTVNDVDGIELAVTGVNFVPSNPGPGATILFEGTARTTACPDSSTCTTTLTAADVMTAGDKTVQVENPNLLRSNQVVLRVLPEDTTEDVISLTGASPAVTGKDIVAVEPATAGSAAAALNLTLLGVFSGNTCNVSGRVATITRPPPGALPLEVRICVGGTGTSPLDTFTLSGPTPNDVLINVPPGQPVGSLSVEVRLTLNSSALPGVRTLFIESAKKDKTAATGAIEVK